MLYLYFRKLFYKITKLFSMSQQIKYGIIHCSDTYAGSNIRASDIDRWHKAPPRNWKMIGYHKVICIDGEVEDGRPLDDDTIIESNEIGAHAYGFNRKSVGICLIGGKGKTGHEFNFNDHQIISLKIELLKLIEQVPDIKFCGHRQVNATHCPAFDVPNFLECIGIPTDNIAYEPKIKL